MGQYWLATIIMLATITERFQWVAGVEAVTVNKELPLYWAWSLQQEDTSAFLNISKKMLTDSLQEVPAFFSDVKEFTQQATVEEITGYYARNDPDSDELHCTAMYNGLYPNYTDGAEDYAARLEVEESIGKSFTLHSIGWILTPRTFGARLYLTEEQLILWNNEDTEVETPPQTNTKYQPSQVHHGNQINVIPQDPDILGNFRPTSGRGSRAHLTLGCAPGVSAVTTGLDLVEIINQESIADESISTYNVTNGWLRSYGSGQWVFYPRTQYLLHSEFLGYTSVTSQCAATCKSVGFIIFIIMLTNTFFG